MQLKFNSNNMQKYMYQKMYVSKTWYIHTFCWACKCVGMCVCE